VLYLCVGGGVDYNSGPYTVMISAGSDRGSFNVPVNNDNMVEGNENFILTIDMSSLPNEFVLGPVSQTTVTIRDEDSKLVIKSAYDAFRVFVYILNE